MNKKALLVGINYPGTSHALRGCVNDVKAVEKVLKEQYEFEKIEVLTDGNATTRKIMNALNRLVKDAAPGDILVFHYSGHGSQVVDSKHDADHEPDGMDEILCPIDLDWRTKIIRDDDLRKVFDTVPAGINLTVVLDCCHSGSGLDQENQYQPEVTRELEEEKKPGNALKMMPGSRYLEPPQEVMILKEEKKLDFYKPRAVTRDLDKTGLLISGCQSHQTSADAYIGNKYIGACTYMLLDVLKHKNYDVDYKTLVDEMNKRMVEYGFTQRPELNGSMKLFGHNYLAPMGEKPQEDVVEEDVEDDRPEPDVPPRPKRPRPKCIRCGNERPACKRECGSGWNAAYWRSRIYQYFHNIELAEWRKRVTKWEQLYGDSE